MVELRRKGLIVRQDQCWPVEFLYDLSHSEGLAGACDAKQYLVFIACVDARDQFGDRARLVTLGCVFRDELEVHPCRIRQGEGEDA